jgi:Holliday junction resolvase RusA-like endonuclease
MKIEFEIKGNHEDPEGNPVPYVRSTKNALWRKDGRRYFEWKNHVLKSYEREHRIYGITVNLSDKENIKNKLKLIKKPFQIKRKARMDIKILWKNRQHGDPDNIWKGIADALFVDDKNLDGSFESAVAPDGKGRVQVKIEVYD